MIRKRSTTVMCLVVVSLLFTARAWATPESPAVLLDKAGHFTAPDGTDVLVAAGTYRLEQSAETQLRLVADPPQPAVEIQATATTHEETVASPMALAIAEEGQEDEVHLVLLLPDGRGLDATGTFSGTRSRGSRVQPINRLQMQQALNQIQPFPQRPSNSPLFRVPPSSNASQAQVKEDTGVVTVPLRPAEFVTWGCLRMHSPHEIVSALKDVQAGKRGAYVLEGLASPERMGQLLAARYPDTQTLASPNQQDVATRRLNSNALAAMSQQAIQSSPSAGVSAISPDKSATSINNLTWTSLVTPTVEAKIGSRIKVPLLADFSPKQLALGSIWDGQTPRGRVRIIASREGSVTVSLAKPRPFRIVEMHASSGVLRRVTAKANTATVVSSEPTQSRTQPPWTIVAKSGQDILVTVEFAPHFDLFSGDSAGRYYTTLDVYGDQWSAQIPVSGFFNGIKIGMVPVLDSYQVDVINPFAFASPHDCAMQIPQGLTLSNADQQAHTVVIEAAGFPGQFSMAPVAVTIPGGATQHVQLPIVLHCLTQISSDEFELNLTINYEGQERSTGFTLGVYPYIYRWEADGNLGSCKYASTFTAHPDGQFDLSVSVSASSVGSREFDYSFYLLDNPVAQLQLYPGGVFASGTAKSYGFRQPGLAVHYESLFAQKADVRLRCASRGPL
ncbi:MAG: hypothetical protein KGS09_10020 [Nitrospirae bacterium]|nr:hypothetical protein [Nitrospirota bacterium]